MSLSKYEPGWKLLGETVRRRRDRLGITQEQVAEAGGPSAATLRLIENAQAKDPRSKTLFSLDHALGWRRGSAIGLVEGKVPPGGWEFHFDEFVEDLIDYVTDQSREQFDVPVSPRQRRFEMHSGGAQSERLEGEADEVLADMPDLSLRPRQGLAALLPPEELWQPLDPERLATDIVERLPDLSIADLDRVAREAQSVRRGKAVQVLKEADLFEPQLLRKFVHSRLRDESVRPRLATLHAKYQEVTERVLMAHEQVAPAKRAYVRASSPENRSRVEKLEARRDDVVNEARALLEEFRLIFNAAVGDEGSTDEATTPL